MGTFHSMDVYLVRHGVTNWNKEKRYLGHSDEPLLEGELHRLNPLRNALNRISFDYCYSSDLKRCIETFQYLTDKNQVCIDQRLRELHFGDWEGLTYEQLKDDSYYQKWLNDWELVAPPNGETSGQFNERIVSFLAELLLLQKKKRNNVLIATHGGVIRAILMKFAVTKTLWELPIQHAKGYRLSLQHQGGEWLCNSLLEVPILEKDQLPGNDILQ